MLLVAAIAGACTGSSVSTPSNSSSESPGQTASRLTSQWPTLSPWSAETPWPTDTPWPTLTPASTETPWPTITPWPTDTPSPTEVPEPTTAPTLPFKPKSDKIEVAMGQAGPLAPAADGGDKAAAEINDFGFDLLRRLDPAGDLCVSPTSIALALAMVRPGAKGQTATEMDKVLRLFGSDDQASEIVALLAALKADNYTEEGYDDNGNPVSVQEARLDVANATFAQRGMSLEQAYLDALSSRFASGMYLVDYQKDPEAARKLINDWVYDHTQGRIPEILAPGDVDESDSARPGQRDVPSGPLGG